MIALPAFSPSARAAQYDFTYSASSTDQTIADGQLDVVNGIAVSGSLDIAAGPDAGDYNLVSGVGSDSSFVYDDYVFPNSNTGFVDSSAGLLWSISGQAGNSPEINMWYNPTAEYGAPADTYSLWNNGWVLESYGNASLTPLAQGGPGAIRAHAVPENYSTFTMLAGALLGLFALQSQFSILKLCSVRVTRSVSFS